MAHSPDERSGHANMPARPVPPIELCSVVVTQCRAQPGQEAALRHLLHQTLREHLSHTPHTQPGWVLQSLDEPRQVLSVHECPGLASYLQASASEKVQRELADLVTTPVQHTFYRSCAFYENMGVKPALVTGIRIEVPPPRAPTLDHLLQVVTWPALKSLPELVLRVCYQEAAAPHRFLLVHGWRSAAAHGSVVAGVAASVQPALKALGAHLTYLIARD
jgi:hypothetical protein